MATPTPEFMEIIKFRFGIPVMASDGPAGFVEHVVVDSSASAVTHVGVRLLRLGGRAHNVPVAAAVGATAEHLDLSSTLEEIRAQSQATPAGTVVLNHATVVDVNGKRAGRLAQVSAGLASHGIHRLVVARGLGRGEVLVPFTGTASWETKHVSVQLPEAQARALVNYRPDDDLLREVEQALFDYPRLRLDLRAIQVRAVDGDVWLMGHISGDLNSRVAEDQLVDIPGIAAVHNRLIADTDLAASVADALARAPQTSGQHIGVYPALGEIRLRGVVNAQGARDAATQVAQGVKGVRRVVNELQIDPSLEVIPVLAGITGREDMVPGGR